MRPLSVGEILKTEKYWKRWEVLLQETGVATEDPKATPFLQEDSLLKAGGTVKATENLLCGEMEVTESMDRVTSPSIGQNPKLLMHKEEQI